MSAVQSPKAEWRRPCDIMKLHRRKKRADSGKTVECRRDILCSKSPLHDATNARLNAGKRRNPFSCHPDSPVLKKQNSCEKTEISENVDPPKVGLAVEEEQDIENKDPRLLFRILDGADQVTEKKTVTEVQQPSQTFNEQCIKLKKNSEDLSSPKPVISSQSGEVSHGPRWESGVELPMDWSLKQKARFLSPKSFSWCAMLKSMEEAQGMNAFITREEAEKGTCSPENGSGKEFQRCIMHWIHPNLPWLRLFPRITNDNKVSRPSLATTDDEVLNALRTDWAESFTSAFYLVRAKYCPYFYLCAHQFSVMFRAAGVQGQTITAVVTPTTRGFREALIKEGIDFTLPLLEKQKDSSELDPEPAVSLQSEKLSETPADEDEMEKSDDAAASVWLESIGLNKANFPELDPAKVKIQREGYKVIDNRPESMVLVEGGNVQALFNFLLNWRSCVASSGAQTGLPPTILSPVGFRGATLKSLKVKQASAKQQDEDGTIRAMNVLELTGPILPHNIQSLSGLFATTQSGEFSATLNTHDPTTPMNAGMHDKNATKAEQSPSSDVDKNLVKQTSIERGAVKEIEYANGKFHWNV